MKRMIMGAVWGMILYILGTVVAGLIGDGQTAEASRLLIAISAAAVAAVGSWKGWLPGTRGGRDGGTEA
jgi:hypothetical protein